MDVGIDRKQIKGKPGIHVHFYSSQAPKVYTIEPNELMHPITAERLCIRMFTDYEGFQFDERENNNGTIDDEHCHIYPGTMHLFQLWDCEARQFKVRNLYGYLGRSWSVECRYSKVYNEVLNDFCIGIVTAADMEVSTNYQFVTPFFNSLQQ